MVKMGGIKRRCDSREDPYGMHLCLSRSHDEDFSWDTTLHLCGLLLTTTAIAQVAAAESLPRVQISFLRQRMYRVSRSDIFLFPRVSILTSLSAILPVPPYSLFWVTLREPDF